MKSSFGKNIMLLVVASVALAFIYSLEMLKQEHLAPPAAYAEAQFTDGTLLRAHNRSEIFIIFKNKKKHVPDAAIFASYGYRFEDVQIVDEDTLSRIPDVKLIRAAGRPEVYYLDRGQKRWIKNEAVFEGYGLPWDEILTVNLSDLSVYREARLLQAVGDEKVHYITQNGARRHIPTPQVFESYGNKWEAIVPVTHEDLMSYPINGAIQLEGTNKIYWLVAGKTTTRKHWIKDPNAFNRLGIRWDQITPVNSQEFSAYPEGDAIGAEDIIIEQPSVSPLSEDELKIQNALSRGVAINPQSDILLKDRSDYQIFYILNSKTFLISVLSSNFSEIKATAENDLLNLLGVSRNTFCGLTIEITTPRYVNPQLAGQKFFPALCP